MFTPVNAFTTADQTAKEEHGCDYYVADYQKTICAFVLFPFLEMFLPVSRKQGGVFMSLPNRGKTAYI